MKKLRKDTRDFVKVGVGLGVGTAIVAGTGHGGAVLPAFSTAGSMMSIVPPVVMGGTALRMLKKYPAYKKKKNWRY